jgi:hypothetical protein
MYILDYTSIYILICPHKSTMPSLQIYLNQRLFDFVRQDKSRIIQQALKEYIARHSDNTDANPSPASQDNNLPE